jgi:hypothetical protein
MKAPAGWAVENAKTIAPAVTGKIMALRILYLLISIAQQQ